MSASISSSGVIFCAAGEAAGASGVAAAISLSASASGTDDGETSDCGCAAGGAGISERLGASGAVVATGVGTAAETGATAGVAGISILGVVNLMLETPVLEVSTLTDGTSGILGMSEAFDEAGVACTDMPMGTLDVLAMSSSDQSSSAAVPPNRWPRNSSVDWTVVFSFSSPSSAARKAEISGISILIEEPAISCSSSSSAAGSEALDTGGADDSWDEAAASAVLVFVSSAGFSASFATGVSSGLRASFSELASGEASFFLGRVSDFRPLEPSFGSVEPLLLRPPPSFVSLGRLDDVLLEPESGLVFKLILSTLFCKQN